MSGFGDAEKGQEMMEKLFGREETHTLMTAFKQTSTAEKDQWEEDVRAFTFGNVYYRPGLDLRTRALLTIGVNAAFGNMDILEAWIRASRNMGIPQEEVRETLIQVSLYAGFPNSRRSLQTMQRVFEEQK